MNKPLRITFGIIVLNGEPFIRYNLRALYPFAHQIIIVEGAAPAAANISTPDGHSTDGTLKTLHDFKSNEDPDNKLIIVTAEDEGYQNGFWPGEKDEQSKAYTLRATGDFLWQIDIDEFYHAEDIHKIIKMLTSTPDISGVSFYWKNFWGGFNYLVDGWEYRNIIKNMNGNRRLFRWDKEYRYVSHRPPTVMDDKERDLCSLNWIGPDETLKMNIFCYHYGMVLPKQALLKTLYYQNLWQKCENMDKWYRNSYLNLHYPFRVLHGTKPPSWLLYFKGSHPLLITTLIQDIKNGTLNVETRRTDDIDALLKSSVYQLKTKVIHYLYHISYTIVWLYRNIIQIFNKMLNR